jgi:DNA-directed RNA polymerase subunit RPC12/RpoP
MTGATSKDPGGSDGRALHCAHCGARVSVLGDESHARCGYCGTETPVPAALRDAIRNAEARKALEEVKIATMRGAQTFAETERRMAPLQWGLPALVSFAVLGMTIAQTGFNVRYLAPGAVTALTMLTGGVTAVVVGRTKHKEWLRALPLAPPEGAGARCPECGGALDVDGGPTARCRHCQLTSLLPPSALAEGSRMRQLTLVAERERAMASSAESIRRAQILSIAVFGVLFVGTIVSWVVASS